jgi:uncharacterized damage-inducible protein DinB
MASPQLTSFQSEYLWELSIPKIQLLALAEAIPEEAYGWRPAEDARTFSAVLVHIGAAMMMLLHRAEAYTPEVMEFCGSFEGEGMPMWVEMVHRSQAREKSITGKSDIVELLHSGFATVERTFTAMTEEKLAEKRDFGGETTTARRIYLRILAHNHEHMGQAVAYAREMGFHVPWPDPVKEMERMVATGARR